MGGDPSSDVMDYVTIASAGDAADFGDLSSARYFMGTTSATTITGRNSSKTSTTTTILVLLQSTVVVVDSN